MKQWFLVLMIACLCSAGAAAAGEEKAVFGPEKYDVKERYGAPNAYDGGFKAGDGLYVIKFQLGDQVPERPEFLEFTLNGVKILRDDRYDYGYIACIVPLQKENTFHVVMKDVMPSGFKRPPLPPRSVIVTVLPYAGKLLPAGYGVNAWTELDDVLGLLQKMAGSESEAFALSSINLTKDPAARAEAMRRLSDRKDPKALEFITSVFNNLANDADVRGEAALALGLLGDKSSVLVLMPGVTDAAEKTRIAASRALSFYKEEDTREPLMKLLERLDTIRRDAVIASIVSAGWKPVSTLVTMAESPDPLVSRNAIGILGSTRDPRATDLLLKLLRDPGQRDVKAIISALGDTHDPRAVQPLFSIAKDRSKRTGKEVELGEALAELGDRQSADVVADMIKHVETRTGRMHLQQAYKKLTGKDYNK